MQLLKPLFFGKYKTNKKFEYPEHWQDVSMQRPNGKLSIAYRLSQTEEVKGVIILAHPMKNLGKYFFVEYGHAELYTSQGYHVFIFDFNGFGESEDNGTYLFPEDILDVLSVVRQKFPKQPIGLHGISFGASQIIIAALEEKEHLIKGLLVESAVSSNIDYYRGKGGYLFQILNWYNVIYPRGNARNIYTKQVENLEDISVLFIYGEQDVTTPKWMGELLYEHTQTDKEIVVFQSQHLTTIHDEEERYKEVVFGYWNRVFTK